MQETLLDQHQFEFAIYQCLRYGDETKLAQKNGKGVSFYSQMLNPEDPRESYFYRAAQDFIYWMEINPQGGRDAFNTFCSLVTERMPVQSDGLCIETETCNTLKEAHDIATVKINGGSLYDQLREVVEAQAQNRRLKNAILAAINAEKDSANGKRTRLSSLAPPAEAAEFASARRNGRAR